MRKERKKYLVRKIFVTLIYWLSWICCWIGLFSGLNSCLDPNLSNSRWFSIMGLSMISVLVIALYMWVILYDALTPPVNGKRKIRRLNRQKRLENITNEIKYISLEGRNKVLDEIRDFHLEMGGSKK